MHRHRAKMATGLFTALIFAGALKPATLNAAVVYQIAIDPSNPSVGQVATISVATFEADFSSPRASLKPFPLGDFPWRFVADSPGDETFEIALHRVGGSSHQWRGSFTFEEPGRWEVGLDRSHLGIPPDPALGARIAVSIRPAGDFDPTVLPLFAVAIIVAIVALAWGLLRSRGRPSPVSG